MSVLIAIFSSNFTQICCATWIRIVYLQSFVDFQLSGCSFFFFFFLLRVIKCVIYVIR